jgi:acyl-CoA thioester hydrolase
MPSASQATPGGPASTVAVTVRWAECDPAGILYHPRVFDWFSEARVAWLAARGMSYYETFRPRRIEILVLACHAEFLRPARPGDQLTVWAWADQLTPTRMNFYYRVEREGVEVSTGSTEHVFVRDGKPVNLKKAEPVLFRNLADSVNPALEA